MAQDDSVALSDLRTWNKLRFIPDFTYIRPDFMMDFRSFPFLVFDSDGSDDDLKGFRQFIPYRFLRFPNPSSIPATIPLLTEMIHLDRSLSEYPAGFLDQFPCLHDIILPVCKPGFNYLDFRRVFFTLTHPTLYTIQLHCADDSFHFLKNCPVLKHDIALLRNDRFHLNSDTLCFTDLCQIKLVSDSGDQHIFYIY